MILLDTICIVKFKIWDVIGKLLQTTYHISCYPGVTIFLMSSSCLSHLSFLWSGVIGMSFPAPNHGWAKRHWGWLSPAAYPFTFHHISYFILHLTLNSTQPYARSVGDNLTIAHIVTYPSDFCGKDPKEHQKLTLKFYLGNLAKTSFINVLTQANIRPEPLNQVRPCSILRLHRDQMKLTEIKYFYIQFWRFNPFGSFITE